MSGGQETNMTNEQTIKTKGVYSLFKSFRERVSKTNNMNNKEKQDQIKAIEVLEKEGDAAFVNHVFTDQKTGKPLTYGEMRARYG